MCTQVLTVRDIMKYGVRDHMGARVELEELATKALKYQIAEGFSEEDLSDEVRFHNCLHWSPVLWGSQRN